MHRSDFLRLLLLGAGTSALAPGLARAQEFDPAPPEGLVIDPVPPSPAPPAPGSTKAWVVNRGPGFANRIALTFDDGPSPGVTDKVLAELDRRRLKATFFMIGKKAEAYPKLAAEVAAAGHEIANHTYTHPALNRLSADRVEYEIFKAQDVIAQATGREAVWFRPPYGAFRPADQGAIPRTKSLGVAMWSVDPRDWAKPGASTIVQRIAGSAHPGSIILLHDLHHQTAEATGDVLDRLLDKSYNFATLTHLFGTPYGPFQPA
jgi:peptidoglycan/xylan/chitin deacetylase (PgdA/CDA1 family)